MKTAITPLPAKIHGQWSQGQIKDEITAREARVSELLAQSDEALTGADVEEATRLNDEIDQLRSHEVVRKIPLPPGSRGGFGQRNEPEFGPIPGIGDAFLNGPNMMALLDGTSGGSMVPAFFDPGIRDLPQRPLFVRSVIPTVKVDGDKVWYLRQTVATQNAATVAAGALKPTSVYTVERIEETIRTIAHVSEALDRALLSDYDQLGEFLDGQLRLGVLLEEEDQIINGDGTAPNISGILDQTGLQTQAKGADPTPNAIFKAITKVRVVFHEPDAIVLHPNDWQEIRLLATADGIYLAGEMGEGGEERLWGKQVITSPVIAEGTGLVGAFGTACKVYDREQARVSFAETGLGDSAGQELFTRNQVRFRGESRLGFGCHFPSAFCKVTGI